MIMNKRWIGLAAVLALFLVAVLVLPYLFDANRYRGLIESRAEKALGRDVRLGEMHLSLFPSLGLKVDDLRIGALPEEGGGDLATARGLRVGARLGPLLRGRLEVTSLVLEEPEVVLARDREGTWNVERLVAGDAAEESEAAAGGDGELSIDRLRLSGGTITVRDASALPAFEVVLSGLDLDLDGVSPGGAWSFELATSFASAPEARLEIAGRGSPPGDDGQSLELHADVEVRRMTGDLLSRLATAAGVSAGGAVGERPFDVRARLDVTPGAISLSGVEVDGADLDLRRDREGRFNVTVSESVPESAGPPEEPQVFSVQGVRLTGVRLRLRDAAGGRAPLDLTLEGLEAELDGWPATVPAGFKLAAKIAGGGSLEVAGSAGPEGANGFDFSADVRGGKLPGSLLAGLAAAGGVALDGVLGERPIDVDARLESAGGQTAITRLELRGADLDLRRDRGGRWNFRLPEGGGDDSAPLTVRNVTLEALSLQLRDETAGERPLEAALDDLLLTLDQLPSEGPATFRLQTRVSGDGGEGRIEVGGTAGPATAGGDLPLRLTARVDALPLAIVQPALEMLAGTGEDAGRADLEIEVSGTFPGRLETTGSARVTGAAVASAAVDSAAVDSAAVDSAAVESGEPGRERPIRLDLDARFDAIVRRGGEDFELRTFDVDLEGSTLSLAGTVRQEGEAKRWDMALAPTRLPPDRLRALLALFAADDLLTFSGAEPIEIEARVQGSTAPGAAMDVSGRAAVRDLRLSHPALTLPLESVTAEARLRGESVAITGLSARVGASDLAGEMTIEGLAAPRLAFDLRAQRADLGELLSLAAGDDATAQGDNGTGDDTPLFAEGNLTVATGTWETLAFTDLSARLRLESDVATLEPVTMKLYGGGFQGRVVADLTAEPAAFTLSGDAEGVDVDPFLTSNLDLGNLLFGRFTGNVEARGAGTDFDSILRSLTGGGTARVDDGRLGRTGVLKSLSRVAGVLGQRTLASLAGRLATESTRFERLEGRFGLAEGKVQFEELLLDSPDFALRGKGLADLVSSALAGDFRIAFSKELSELMRLDGSRAAEVFWDPQAAKVAMPLALKGSLAAPTATVDWGAAVSGYAKRRAAEGLLDLLGKALGSDDQDPAPPPPAPEPTAGEDRDLGGEINARWGGSVLFQDLKLDGIVRGWDVDWASLEAVDDAGRVIRRWDRLGDVDAYLANADPAAFAEIRWQARIDGKDLALASLPLTLRLTVKDRGGRRVEVTRVVEK